MRKNIARFFLMILLSACAKADPKDIAMPAGMSGIPSPTPQQTYTVPPVRASWHIQYTGSINYAQQVNVYNIDLFDTPSAQIHQLRERGIFVMCYFSAGSFEDWRPDADIFPESIIGQDYEGWQGEAWLDIRNEDSLRGIMEARLNLARKKGCHGVDPDNIEGYVNETGFPLTYEDQLTYNIWLAEEAHARGLSIGLKNDLNQISDLLPFFDWALNESCFDYDECDMLNPFVKAGKPVFVIEYNIEPSEFCPQAAKMGFNAIYSTLELDGKYTPCSN